MRCPKIGIPVDYYLTNYLVRILVMTVSVGVFEAKARLSELLELVQSGEEVVITKRGAPIATLRRTQNQAERAQAVLDALRTIRKKAKPGPESMRDLIEEGRRYP